MVGEQNKMKGLNQALPSIAVLAVVVGIWWAVVVVTKSAIFPTPWAVVAGTLELARDGTLWEHIGASLMRVGAGFGMRWRSQFRSGCGWAGCMARSSR
jgi:NitT/TauT family transport system permease protein